MLNKKTPLGRFADLTWKDIETWAGGTIVSRGRNYQRQGRVADLAVTNDGGLISWVKGSEHYATMVVMDENGLPDSICTCPYKRDCKHGVAVVLEYLRQVENNCRVPKAKPDDERLILLADGGQDDDEDLISEDMRQDIDGFLKGKTKGQLISLIQDLAGQYPEMAREIADRKQVISGNTKALVTRLRQEIRDLGSEPGWQNYWNSEGYTPDYSGVRKKLETLLKAGHTKEVLTLGRELVTTGMRQVEESHDEGETAMEIAGCLPVIVEALDQSSLDPADKLNWALDAVLEDQFDVCEAFAEYLDRQHPQTAWHTLADRLLAKLHGLKGVKGGEEFNLDYERDRLTRWVIHALERAGREAEIIPLCIAEAKMTGSYDRLVQRLMAAQRYGDAEKWVKKGLLAIGEKWPGTGAGLRDKLREIRTLEHNWPVVTALRVEEFVRRPSIQAFTDCRKAGGKAKAWPQVRASLLRYLENGELPWEQKGWPLPESGLMQPEADQRNRFPLIGDLIDIAILEKKPDQVLKWYDQRPQGRFGCPYLDEDAIADAVQVQAPERAVDIWKNKAERLIAQVKPHAYEEAAKYLRKAGLVMSNQDNRAQWEQYLGSLRETHARKRRLLEVLDGLDEKPLMKKGR
ncbi:MAG: SWIM zinc finger family protein [Thermodesulfobacteriota bacterium]